MLNFFKKSTSQWKVYKDGLKAKNKFLYYAADFVETVVVALAIALVVKQFIIQVSVVPTGSMIPTLIGGDPSIPNERLFVNKFIYDFTAPKRGDIVVFKSPHGDKKDYVKRCIGLPGDTIEIKRGFVFINGKELVLSGVDVQHDYDTFGPVTVPEDSYFMLGDNRAHSMDSRYWGYVTSDDLIGKALFTIWPLTRVRWLK
jgi:signal peptidase I